MQERLSEAIENYSRFRRTQQYAANTLKVDAQVLNRFLTINGNVFVHNINETHVERHFEEASRTRGAASLKNDHATLTSFFKWAKHTRRMPVDRDPMFGRRSPRKIDKERNRVHVSQFGALLDAAEARDPRDRALVALFLYTLCRDSEVTALRVRDLDLNAGTLKVYVEKSRVEDIMPVCTELDQEMRRWLTHYTAEVGRLEPHHFLVPARAVHPVFHPDTKKIIRHASLYKPETRLKGAGRNVKPPLEDIGFPVTDEAGRPCGEGAHTVRRSGARALFDLLVVEGYDGALRIVQAMLHHKSATMTERYLGITADKRTRNDLLKGQRMYGAPSDTNIIKIAQ